MHLEHASLSIKGKPDYNEDCFGVWISEDSSAACFVLCDGLGGTDNGQVAAAIAVETILESIRHAGSAEPRDLLVNALRRADEAIAAAAKSAPSAISMRTTVVAVCVFGAEVWWCHMGDSRLYLLHEGKIVRQTLDHSVPQLLVKTGEITQEDIRHHPNRNALTKCLGSRHQYDPATSMDTISVRGVMTFVLCSDGFWEEIEEAELLQLAGGKQGPEHAAKLASQRLEAIESELEDNATAMFVRVTTD